MSSFLAYTIKILVCHLQNFHLNLGKSGVTQVSWYILPIIITCTTLHIIFYKSKVPFTELRKTFIH